MWLSVLTGIVIVLLVRISGFSGDIFQGDFNKDGRVDSSDTAPVTVGEEEGREVLLEPVSGRFTDNKDGTVTDTETDLMWTKNADLCGDTVLFHQALDYIEAMNGGEHPNYGHIDWRLPNLAELRSLVDYTKLVKWEHTLPTGHPFENVQSLRFNSTDYLTTVDQSWFVSLYCKVVGHNVDSCYGHVWAVRSNSSKME